MGNITGILGLVFGIIAFILVFFFTGIIILLGLILGMNALILSIVGISINDSKAPGIVGLIFSLIVLILGFWF